MPSRTSGHRQVEHTADVALRVWAPDLAELFREAGRGLLDLLGRPAGLAGRERVPLEVEGFDLEELMVSWLNEILFRAEQEGRRFADVVELRLEPAPAGRRLSAVLTGEPYDPQRRPAGAGIKAATYHGLHLAADAPEGYDILLVFDT